MTMWPWLGLSVYMRKCAHMSVCAHMCTGEEPIQVSLCIGEYVHVSVCVACLLSSPKDPAGHHGAALRPFRL